MRPVSGGDPDPQLLARALALHAAAPVTDLHADTFIAVRHLGYDLRRRHRPPRGWNPTRLHCDLPRWREGGVRAQGLGVVVPPWARGAARWAHARRTLTLVERTVRRAGDQLALCRTPAEARAAWARGQLAGFLGVEGFHALDDRPERLEELRRRGVVYLGLCHFQGNQVVAASGERRPEYQGLGPLGAETIDLCNRLGVAVDLAHCHEGSFFAALERSRAPVIVSHGAARALRDHHRNLTDPQLRAIAASGGVVGVIFYPWYLSGRLQADLTRIVDHVDHLVQVMGPGHVALGSDFDGFVWSVQGLPDIAALPRLTCALLARGYDDHTVRGILGANFLRTWEAVCAAAEPGAVGA